MLFECRFAELWLAEIIFQNAKIKWFLATVIPLYFRFADIK